MKYDYLYTKTNVTSRWRMREQTNNHSTTKKTSASTNMFVESRIHPGRITCRMRKSVCKSKTFWTETDLSEGGSSTSQQEQWAFCHLCILYGRHCVGEARTGCDATHSDGATDTSRGIGSKRCCCLRVVHHAYQPTNTEKPHVKHKLALTDTFRI